LPCKRHDFALAAKRPDRIQALVVQNGNAYDEGIDHDFWEPIKASWKEQTAAREQPLRCFLTREATIWQYPHGVRDTTAISPDNWHVDQPLLDRPGNAEVQLALFHSDGSNPSRYPKWQAYLRRHQPPTLVVWGKNDPICPAAGAEPYKKDLTHLEFHLLDTGHFALEEDGDTIADLMRHFLRKYVQR
jgi:pimeloyl-ACP methyl ester carboxylesterase